MDPDPWFLPTRGALSLWAEVVSGARARRVRQARRRIGEVLEDQRVKGNERCTRKVLIKMIGLSGREAIAMAAVRSGTCYEPGRITDRLLSFRPRT